MSDFNLSEKRSDWFDDEGNYFYAEKDVCEAVKKTMEEIVLLKYSFTDTELQIIVNSRISKCLKIIEKIFGGKLTNE